MAHLVEVLADELQPEELIWLDKYSHWDYDGRSFRELLVDVRDGRLTLWRLEGFAGRGLVGTRLLSNDRGTRLWLELVVGEGLLRSASELRSAIHEVGQRAGAAALEGIATRPGLSRLYEKVLGVRPSATLFKEEL